MDPGLRHPIQEPPVPRTSEATLAAIKHAVDIVALVGDYLPVSRSGSKFKALCPFHADHNPSLELNPDRQSYKCWVCGAGGDVFDFEMNINHIEFPEALRMLADRAGIALDAPSASEPATGGVTKTELLAVNAWAEGMFAGALKGSEQAQGYLASRGIVAESVERFRLGYAPGERGWLVSRAKRNGYPVDLLEKAGLVSRPADAPGQVRERFRGRLIFPIHDARGRAIGFGGRVLPEVERLFAASGKTIAKYLNSSETPLFKKRQVLYGADLARTAVREEKWVAVVEGYTDVIAAHQVGLGNVVAPLGTSFTEEHIPALRRLDPQRVILIFDGDAAGQNATDKVLQMFLAHDLDVRILTLSGGLDPCDYLLNEGADAFRTLVAGAVDPLAFTISRASTRFDLGSIEGSRQAADWVLKVLAQVPRGNGRVGVDVKVAKALDTLGGRLRVKVSTLEQRLVQIRREAARQARPLRVEATAAPVPAPPAAEGAPALGGPVAETPADRPPLDFRALDVDDRELIEILLNCPALIPKVISRVAVNTLRDEPLRTILSACYDIYSEGRIPDFEILSLRLDDPELRAFAVRFFLPQVCSEEYRHPFDSQLLKAGTTPAPWDVRLDEVLVKIADRDRQARWRDVKAALSEMNPSDDPETYRALSTELLRLSNQRPDTKKKNAS